MAEERLQKLLARAGVGSRRACEEMIQAGRVAVDGRVVALLGAKADPQRQQISVDGRPIVFERLRYIMLHKPDGVLSGADPKATYPSWESLVPVPERLYAVGRLDHDSEGLLLLTNDGELALHLSHPRYEHPKTYLVQVEGRPDARKIRRLQHGVMLEDGPTLPAQVALLREAPVPSRGGQVLQPAGRGAPRTSWLRITLREGRKRQVRRMVGLLGHPALRVIRVGLGPLDLGGLPQGRWRDLTAEEIRALREGVEAGRAAAREVVTGRSSISKGGTTDALTPSTIAIDGPSASGKSTIGGLLARRLGYLYFDTGVMYRAVAAVALARRISPHDEQRITEMAGQLAIEILSPTVDDGRDVTVLADKTDVSWEIRKLEVEKAVSPVSTYRGVREAMRIAQRRIGEQGRVVMVGRDIGTVVLPDADLKIYLDATLEERSRRRHAERHARGEQVEFDQVMRDVQRRDHADSTREHAPLVPASDAILIDTTGMDVDEVLRRVMLVIGHWRGQRLRGLKAATAAASGVHSRGRKPRRTTKTG